MPAHVQLAYADDYITQFYRALHPNMTPNTPKKPPRSSNQEVPKAKNDDT